MLVSASSGLVAGEQGGPQGGLLRLSVLSSKPELVSGGDALIRVQIPPGINFSRVKVLRNGTDVTSQLSPDPEGGGLMGVIGGLVNGSNTLAATFDGRQFDRLELTNYPKWGPMISGPHEQPFYCRTTAFTTNLPGGANLGAPLDANYSTNPLERLNAEIKRRTNVVGIFPNDASIARLVGAMLLEQNDEWSLNRRYMQLEGLQTVSDTAPTRLPAVAR